MFLSSLFNNRFHFDLAFTYKTYFIYLCCFRKNTAVLSNYTTLINSTSFSNFINKFLLFCLCKTCANHVILINQQSLYVDHHVDGVVMIGKSMSLYIKLRPQIFCYSILRHISWLSIEPRLKAVMGKLYIRRVLTHIFIN